MELPKFGVDQTFDTIRDQALVTPSCIFLLTSLVLYEVIVVDNDTSRHEKVAYGPGVTLFGRRDAALLLEPGARVSPFELELMRQVEKKQASRAAFEFALEFLSCLSQPRHHCHSLYMYALSQYINKPLIARMKLPSLELQH